MASQTNHQQAIAGALMLATGIALGAFGAHGLKKLISEQYLQVFETGVKYQIYNALGLMAISGRSADLKKQTGLIITGVLIFSISLYLLSMNEVWGEGLRKLGAITPIGGVCMIAGWVWIVIQLRKGNRG